MQRATVLKLGCNAVILLEATLSAADSGNNRVQTWLQVKGWLQ